LNIIIKKTYLKDKNYRRLRPNDPRHFIVGQFKDGVDPKQIARDFDEYLIK
jgi:hypothetical protein